MNKSKLIEITWLILSVLVYALIITDELYFNEGKEYFKYLYIISLLISSVYCLQFICLVFFRPIKRDLILAKGHFLFKVVNFVSLIPIVLISLTTINNKFCTTKISAKDFIFEDNLYSDKYYKQDTVRGYISYNRTDTLCINDTIIPISTTGSDNIYIPVKSKLPDEIYKGQKDPTLLWTILYHYIDPGNQHMTSSKYGRWAASLIAVLGFFLLNGLLISTLINWFDRRREHWLNGNIRYNRWSFWFENVAFVIGANEAAPTIIKRLLGGHGKKPVKYVILFTNENVRRVREQIASYLTDKERESVIIYNGQLDSFEEICKLHIDKATEIYVLGENSNDDISQSYHDTQNMRCVHNIASALTGKYVSRKIDCRVLFEYQTTFSVFQFSDIPHEIRQYLNFIPFNAYENWAERVFVKGEYTEDVKRIVPMLAKEDLEPTLPNKILQPVVTTLQSMMPKKNDTLRSIKYTPLDNSGIASDSKKHVHLVIVGMTKMGVAMGIQVAQIAHYPNFSTGRKDDNGNIEREPSLIRTRITFIDENADKEKDFFMGRYQNLFALSRHRYIDATDSKSPIFPDWNDPMTDSNCEYKKMGANFLDIEWEFVKGNVQTPGVAKYLKDAAAQADKKKNGDSLLTIAICHPLAHEAIAAALYMPSEVYDNALQILVYQREATDIVYNLSRNEDGNNTNNKRYAKLRPFGMKYADFTMDKEHYYRALLCNYVYTLMFDEKTDNGVIPKIISNINLSNKIEEHTQSANKEWDKQKILNKWSNRYLGNSFETKLRSIGALFNNIELHYDIMCAAFENNKKDMAECEHNRWNMQQLLMGLRAYKDQELDEYNKLKAKVEKSNIKPKELNDYKEKLKRGPEKVHLNICPVHILKDTDKYAEVLDFIFNNSIPAILHCIEKHNKEKANSKKA